MSLWGVIPAAGTGKRMPGEMAKQYRLIDGEPVLLHVLLRLEALGALDGFIVGLTPDDRCWSALPSRIKIPTMTCEGGATRAETILRCLDALHHAALDDETQVLIHDAVRPCFLADQVRELICRGGEDEHGALLAQRLDSTLKREDGDGRVMATVPSTGLWLAQTPQVYRLSILREALAQAVAGGRYPDPAGAMEMAGFRPQLIAGSPINFKITFEEDLAIARQSIGQSTHPSMK